MCRTTGALHLCRQVSEKAGYPCNSTRFQYTYDDEGNRTGAKRYEFVQGADNDMPGVFTSAGMSSVEGGFGGTRQQDTDITGNAEATWSFPDMVLQANTAYYLDLSWNSNVAHAYYRIYANDDGETPIYTFDFTQNETPGDFIDGGVSWRTIVLPNFATQQTGVFVTVEVEANQPGALVADAAIFRKEAELTQYEYDYANRMTRLTQTNPNNQVIQAVDYHYDVLGRRMEKVVDPDGSDSEPAEHTAYVYDGVHAVLEFDNDDHLANRKLYGAAVDQVLAVEDLDFVNNETVVDKLLWTLPDHQGTVRDVYYQNEEGEYTATHLKYDEFGKPIAETIPTAISTAVVLYTGRDYDPESGLMYYRTRYYDPGAGRFTTEDSAGFGGGDTNLYRYVGNSPANYVDPKGEALETVWDIASVAVGTASAVWDIHQIATTGEGWGNLGMDLLGIGADLAAAAIPFLPGGVSIAIKANRAVSAADVVHDAARTIQRADVLANMYQGGQAALAAREAYASGDNYGYTLNAGAAVLGYSHAFIRVGQAASRMIGVQPRQVGGVTLLSDFTGGLVGSRMARNTGAPATVSQPTRLTWNEFRSQIGGHGYSKTQISRLYRKYLDSKGIEVVGQSKRLKYLGATPGKDSATGRAVIDRMRTQGRVLDTPAGTFVKDADGSFYPLAEMDMGHFPVDGVTYWNSVGIQHGPKTSPVRQWMLNSNNYELQHFSRNRSLGSQLGETYIDP